jgi:POT family proton-dependent oligopeptide transporter
MKTLASAANLFMVGSAPNVFCLLLYNACETWFLNARGTTNIHHLRDYATAKVVNYFWVLEFICLLGVVINVLPPIKNWVADLEEAAAETVKSPMSTPSIRKNLMQRRKLRREGSSGSISFTQQSQDANEETPLVKARKHQQYLKYGAAPVLMKSGSMRAGPSLKKSPQRVKQQQQPPQAVLNAQVRDMLLGLEDQATK